MAKQSETTIVRQSNDKYTVRKLQTPVPPKEDMTDKLEARREALDVIIRYSNDQNEVTSRLFDFAEQLLKEWHIP